MIFILLLINFAISWFNALSCGKSWAETKAQGGFLHFVNWCGAVMSACGFTWVYAVVLAIAAIHFHFLAPRYIEGLLGLTYLMIILPILGSGLGITLQSWAVFWRRKTFANGAMTAWNTFAQIHNIYGAASAIPDAFLSVTRMFRSDDEEDNGASTLVIALVLGALLGGVLTTSAILRKAAKGVALDFETQRQQALRGEGTQWGTSGWGRAAR
jgi:hypothetical protein